MDADLIFATPGLVDEFDQAGEPLEKIAERAWLTSQFLKGKVSVADFLDYLSESARPDPGQFLDNVEQNFNAIVDIHGRPIL